MLERLRRCCLPVDAATDDHHDAIKIRTPSRPVLHEAARVGDELRVRAALAQTRGSIDRLEFGFAPIHLAAKGGHSSVLGLLLERGADPDALMGDGISALMGAAFFGRPACVAALLEFGADRSFFGPDATAESALRAMGQARGLVVRRLRLKEPVAHEELLAAVKSDEGRQVMRALLTQLGGAGAR